MFVLSHTDAHAQATAIQHNWRKMPWVRLTEAEQLRGISGEAIWVLVPDCFNFDAFPQGLTILKILTAKHANLINVQCRRCVVADAKAS
jgi:hypothetical protein